MITTSVSRGIWFHNAVACSGRYPKAQSPCLGEYGEPNTLKDTCGPVSVVSRIVADSCFKNVIEGYSWKSFEQASASWGF